MQKSLLDIYQEELGMLRNNIQELSREHPHLSSLIGETGEDILDPQVKQLLEGVAFLNSRVRCQLDDGFSELGAAFLELLCPHYLSPLPAMSILQINCHDSLQKPVSIPKGQLLETNPMSGFDLCFSTCYDVELIPIAISEITTDTSLLKIPGDKFQSNLGVKLICQDGNQTFENIKPECLRFYLNANSATVEALYTQLLEHTAQISIFDIDQPEKRIHLPVSALKPVGFTQNQNILPKHLNVLSGQQLLTEFFCYPHKFWFVDININDLSIWENMGSNIYLTWHMKRPMPYALKHVTNDMLQLNCTPIVNLFNKTSQAITFDHRQSEYPVSIDNEQEQSLEIYSIDKVIQQDSEGNLKPLAKIYSIEANRNKNGTVWWSTRKLKNTEMADLDSRQVSLSFVDLAYDVEKTDSIIMAETTCCNGSLPHTLAMDNRLPSLQFVDPPAPIMSTRLLTLPTRLKYHPTQQENSWHFMAQAMLKQIDFTNTENISSWLTTLFNLYEFSNHKTIHSLRKKIKSISCARKLARLPQLAQNNFCYGTQVVLDLLEGNESSIPYLFMHVLDEFLVQFTQLNSFSQLIVKNESRIIKKWPPRSMTQLLN